MVKTYQLGMEAIGADMGSFLPWLNIVSSVAGGAMGGGKDDKKSDKPAAPAAGSTVAEQVKAALDADRLMREKDKAVESAKTAKMVAIGAASLLGVGIFYLMVRK